VGKGGPGRARISDPQAGLWQGSLLGKVRLDKV